MAYRLGVDVGGTFTDLFLVEDSDHRQWRVKTPSTPSDPSQGVLKGVSRICEEAGISPADLANVVHGTTVATNAVLESKGARVGLITTQGFGQILHLARSQTPGPLAGWIIMVKPDPPASLADTREAVERLDARGNTLVAVDTEQVKGIIEDLVGSGVESLTISLINSYVNGAHEQQIADLVEELHPGFPVTISSAVLPEFREYERTLTACMNSYVRPQVAQYVDRLQSSLSDMGVKTEVDILRSDAGVMTPAEAARNPVYGVLSGPSGGVAGALYVAARAGFPNVLTFDMGGTSTDVSLCQAGEPTIGRETTIGQFRIKVPSVDVHTVGAGGGSIAHVPQLTGALRVGPQSAGAEPGPGRVRPGRRGADRDRRQRRPRASPGRPDRRRDDARRRGGAHGRGQGRRGHGAPARGSRGRHPADRQREHGRRAARDQRAARPRPARVRAGGLRRRRPAARQRRRGADGLVPGDRPALAGARCARWATWSRASATSSRRRSSGSPPRSTTRTRSSRELETRARDWMEAQGIAAGDQHIEFIADMRYRGQGYEIPVPWGDGLDETFNDLHEQLYGFRMPNTASEIVNLRAVGTGDRPQPELPEEEPRAEALRRPARTRAPTCTRARRSPARRSSPSSTRPPSCSRATRPRSTATSTS